MVRRYHYHILHSCTHKLATSCPILSFVPVIFERSNLPNPELWSMRASHPPDARIVGTQTCLLRAISTELTPPSSKAKKRCDQGQPSCERCVRLGKRCSGYRNLTDLIFKDETETVTRRAASAPASEDSTGSSSTLTPITRQPSPDKDEVAKRFFFDHFVTPHHLPFLLDVTPDEFLLKPIMACALAAMANRSRDQTMRERSRQFYVNALTATNAAIRHPRRIREDDTLIAVCLLSCYEVSGWCDGLSTPLIEGSVSRGTLPPPTLHGSSISRAQRRFYGSVDRIKSRRRLERFCFVKSETTL